jgi:hypothetical protein
MTEQEWRECRDPNAMLAALRGKASERKRKLFRCACWRLVWHLLEEGPPRQLVEAMEREADNPITGAAELMQAHVAANAVRERQSGARREGNPQAKALQRLLNGFSTAGDGTGDALMTQLVVLEEGGEQARRKIQQVQCELLRDLVRNSFRPARIDPAWLKANDGAAPKLARAIYDERAFAQLPVLGDALEDAGCTDAEVLAHCRRAGTHVRGCWVVDAVLGKG